MLESKNKKMMIFAICLISIILCVYSEFIWASDFRSGMIGIKNALSHTVLPLLSVIGVVIAAFSLLTGNPNAKQHVVYALIGTALGFGAQAIIDFIKSSVTNGF